MNRQAGRSAHFGPFPAGRYRKVAELLLPRAL